MKVNEMVKCRQCLAQNQCSYVTDDEEKGFYNTAALRECQEEERKLCLSHGYVFSMFSPLRPSHPSLGTGITS